MFKVYHKQPRETERVSYRTQRLVEVHEADRDCDSLNKHDPEYNHSQTLWRDKNGHNIGGVFRENAENVPKNIHRDRRSYSGSE